MKNLFKVIFILFCLASLSYAKVTPAKLSEQGVKYFAGFDFSLARYYSDLTYTDNSTSGGASHTSTSTGNFKELGLSLGAIVNNYKFTGFFATTDTKSDIVTNSNFGLKVDYLIPLTNKLIPFIGIGAVYNISKGDLQKAGLPKTSTEKNDIDFSGAGLLFNAGADFKISNKIFASLTYQMIYNIFGSDTYTRTFGSATERDYERFGMFGSKTIFSLNYIF